MSNSLSLAEIEALARDTLRQAGVPETSATAMAQDIALAEADGDPAQGMASLLRDLQLIRYGRVHPAAEPQITRPAPAVLRVDAQHGLAGAALRAALPDVLQMARSNGVSVLHLINASPVVNGRHILSALRGAGVLAGLWSDTGLSRVTHADAPLFAPADITPQPADDDPTGGAISHQAWLVAMDPKAIGLDIGAQTSDMGTQRGPERIALPTDLLAEIINA